MSKLSHRKAILRNRRTKHGHVKRYTKREMRELMPGFRNSKTFNLNGIIEANVRCGDSVKSVWIQIDKNGQICDCMRVGNVFTYLQGRCPQEVNWEYRFTEALN